MTHAATEKPPWHSNAGWPFAADSWITLREDAEMRDEYKSEAVEALDMDVGFDKIFEATMGTMERLEIISETFILFLDSLEDGVVTVDMWNAIEAVMISREKMRPPPSHDDDKTALLEILVTAPNHNVSFILITTMLTRIIAEILAQVKQTAEAEKRSVEVPDSPKNKVASGVGFVRRKTLSLSAVPEIARRQLMERTLSGIFAGAMIRVPDLPKGKEREKKAREERMVRFVEIFVRDTG
jgi:inositol polyphosphate 5-phosphatase INPP5B/F